jgi:hypothetical protein
MREEIATQLHSKRSLADQSRWASLALKARGWQEERKAELKKWHSPIRSQIAIVDIQSEWQSPDGVQCHIGCSESIYTRDITNELLDTKWIKSQPFRYTPHRYQWLAVIFWAASEKLKSVPLRECSSELNSLPVWAHQMFSRDNFWVFVKHSKKIEVWWCYIPRIWRVA